MILPRRGSRVPRGQRVLPRGGWPSRTVEGSRGAVERFGGASNGTLERLRLADPWANFTPHEFVAVTHHHQSRDLPWQTGRPWITVSSRVPSRIPCRRGLV